MSARSKWNELQQSQANQSKAKTSIGKQDKKSAGRDVVLPPEYDGKFVYLCPKCGWKELFANDPSKSEPIYCTMCSFSHGKVKCDRKVVPTAIGPNLLVK